MDQEDINFLEDIAEEFLRIDPKMYKAEAVELKNIIYRESQSQKVRFICAKCGTESWFSVDFNTYVVTAMDLICDDCNPIEDDDLTEDEKALVKIGAV